MNSVRLPLLGIGALIVAAACAQQETTAPYAAGPSLNTTSEPGDRVGVCKDASAPSGTYEFTVEQSGGRGGTLLAGSSFTLGAGACVDVWEALPDPPSSDPLVTVTITEVNLPAGVQFDSAVVNAEVPPSGTVTTIAASTQVNFWHGSLITYFNSEEPPTGFEGCTPGYWKNHLSSWPTSYAPGDDFDATFGVNAFSPNLTLLAAAKLGGGGLNKLARHGVAALLNAASSVDYPQGAADVIAAVAAAINAGTYEPLATQLDTWNNLGCPLN